MNRRLRLHLPVGLLLAIGCVTAVTVLGPAATAATQGKNVVGAVYTQTNSPAGNQVVVYDRYGDGTLAKRQAVSTGGNGSTQDVGCGVGCPILDSQNEVVVSKNGNFVFAVNAGSNTVSSFVETGSGLALVDQLSSGGVRPESIALRGPVLYVLNVATNNPNGTTGNVYGIRVAADGHLTPIGSSQPLAHAAPPDHSADPRAIDFDARGKVLVVTELAAGFNAAPGPPLGAIDTFVVGQFDKAGPVVSHPTSDGFPFGFALDSLGHLVVSNLHNPFVPNTIGSVSTYSVSSTGGVTPIDTKSSGGVLPCWVVITKNNQTTYVVNTGAGVPAPVNGFGLSAGGILNPLAPAAGSLPGEFARTDEALTHNDKYLYVLAPSVGPGAPSHIDGYAVNGNGSLTLVSQTPATDNLGVGASGLAAR